MKIIMAFARLALPVVAAVLMFIGCSTTQDSGDPAFKPNPIAAGPNPEATDYELRVSDALQEAKQSYDDRHFKMSFRMAQTAEQLDREHLKGENVPMALNIQGYSLFQLGLVDDYYVDGFGVQQGAHSKFKEVIAEDKNDFRANLGIGLVSYARHSDHVRKAETLSNGVLALTMIAKTIQSEHSAELTAENRKALDDARKRFAQFTANRVRLIDLGYIFADPSQFPMDEKGNRKKAPPISHTPETDEELAVNVVSWNLDSMIDGSAEAEDVADALAKIEEIKRSWAEVRAYWRKSALTDLQRARDTFLDLRRKAPNYIWLDRDLTLTYQSLGAFFLDEAADLAREIVMPSVSNERLLETDTRNLLLSEGFQPRQKAYAKENYQAALKALDRFIESHLELERMRIKKRDDANYSDFTENPFRVDLHRQIRGVIEGLISEGRDERRSLLLEAAALVIDPMFQINDFDKGRTYANSLKSSEPRDPIHYFVSATVDYYQASGEYGMTSLKTAREYYNSAVGNYNSFLNESSVTTDLGRRNVARTRKLECEARLREITKAEEKAEGDVNSKR